MDGSLFVSEGKRHGKEGQYLVAVYCIESPPLTDRAALTSVDILAPAGSLALKAQH